MACEFCGKDLPLTTEHAWPEWALTYVRGPDEGPFLLTSQRYGLPFASWEGPAPELTVKILCHPCNHDRLGLIEDETAPILKPLIAGRQRLLSRANVAAIALWATKTAMVFEFTGDQRRPPFYTADERRALSLDRRIPDRTTVLVARYSAAEYGLFDHSRDLTLTPSDGAAPYQAMLSTTAIGQFVCQVITHRSSERPTAELGQSARHVVKEIWPETGNLLWPPRFYLDREGLWTFARRGPGGTTGPWSASRRSRSLKLRRSVAALSSVPAQGSRYGPPGGPRGAPPPAWCTRRTSRGPPGRPIASAHAPRSPQRHRGPSPRSARGGCAFIVDGPLAKFGETAPLRLGLLGVWLQVAKKLTENGLGLAGRSRNREDGLRS